MKKTLQIAFTISGLTLGVMILLALIAPQYSIAGGQIPVHWGITGAPDRFIDASEAQRYLWIIPTVLALITLIMALVPMIEPLRENLIISRKTFLAVWIIITATFLFAQFFMAGRMTGWIDSDTAMIRPIIFGVSLISLVLANYFPKTRQSFFLGIRTPWTLTSETSWEKTHKLAAKLFLANGLAGLAVTLLATGALLTLYIPITATSTALFLIIYSYAVWKHADDRTSAPDYII